MVLLLLIGNRWPQFCPQLTVLMRHCWDEDPVLRPTFTYIKRQLKQITGTRLVSCCTEEYHTHTKIHEQHIRFLDMLIITLAKPPEKNLE